MAWLLHDIFHKLCPDEYVKNWHISGNSFSTSPFTQSLLWLWLWFCWTQKMAWKFWLGENGACLCDRQPSHGPCTSPFIIPSSKIIFAFTQSARKLDSRPINWTGNQFNSSIKRWNRLIELSGCGRYMRLHDRRSVFEYCSVIGQFCPAGGQFCPARKWLISLRFFVFVQFAGQFLSPAQFMPNFQWKYFHQKPE